jgi:two-component system, NarL family, sensor histidine kinase DesK
VTRPDQGRVTRPDIDDGVMPARTATPAASTGGSPAAGPPRRTADDADEYQPVLLHFRRVIITGIIAVALIAPAVGVIRQRASVAEIAFMVTGTVFFVVITCWVAVFPGPPGTQRVPWPWLAVIVTLAIALFAVGQTNAAADQLNWVTVLAVAAAACGRFTASHRPALLGAGACVAAGLVAGVWQDFSYGNLFTVTALPAMAAFFAYAAGRRNDAVAVLRRTRGELALVAVAEERLRIARDLHDLLGHSLSLITLKAELAGRLVPTDADRAAREIAELETVARRSLSEVRGAVTGYRQPGLQAELAAARQLLSTAGIACRITVPEPLGLGPDADTLLAWTVREAVTNVVRHSGADRATISVQTGAGGASVQVTDDGGGPGSNTGAGALDGGADPAGLSRPGGTGLAGLAERVGQFGGELTAGAARPKGFRLRVVVPAAASAPGRGPAPAPDGPAS